MAAANKGYQGTYPDAFDAAGDISGAFTDSNNVGHGFVLPANGAMVTYDAPEVNAAASLSARTGGRAVALASRAGNSGSLLIGRKNSSSLLGKIMSSMGNSGGIANASSGLLALGSSLPFATASFGNLLVNSVNASGEIVGLYTNGDAVIHSYLRAANGAITTFDAPNAGTGAKQGTGGLAINASGTIVGGYADTNSVIHGFVYAPALTATATTLQSQSSTSIYGGPITLTATVAPAPPDGEIVYFKSGPTTIGSQTLSGGTAQLTTTEAPAGSDSVTAVYPGDLNFSGSTSTAVSQTVSKATTTTTLTSSPNPSSFEELVTLTATVSGQLGGVATGTMIFKDGTATVGTVSLSGGSAAFPSTQLPQGTHTITAVYSGDANFTGSASSSVTQSVGAEVLNQWTWMGGSSTLPTNSIVAGVYGTLGVPATGNIPGSRYLAATWTDSSGNLWLFGGQGYDSKGLIGSLNDLWKFNPSTNLWAWMGGSSGGGCASGSCSSPGVNTYSGSVPEGRNGGMSWTDQSGNFWLFGGSGYDASGNYDDFNDLWVYNPSTNLWAWIGGSSWPRSSGPFSDCAGTVGSYYVCGQPGVYGASGTPADGNWPGSREEPAGWTDSSGNLWLFGGVGFDSAKGYGYLNDLWEFNTSTKQWTWIDGSSTVPDLFGGQSGVYGALGSFGAGYIPGGRAYALSMTDTNNIPWLFGGYGFDADGNEDNLNDLWSFHPSGNSWGWVSGSSSAGQSGVYGTLGTPAAGNIPGGRQMVAGWTGGNGNLWIFGGQGYDVNGNDGSLNDLWNYNQSTNQWRWMGGGSTWHHSGVYGTLGVPAAGSIPGTRWAAQSWTVGGNLWLFGGYGRDAAGNPGYLNDLWKYQPPATPSVLVTPSASSITTAQALTVKVAVSSGGSTPTGSVTLTSAGYTSATKTLSSGSATFTVPAGSLAMGSDTLTATYAPDSSSSSRYLGAAGSATVNVTGSTSQAITFTDNLPASAPYSAGLSYTLSANGGGSGNPVIFSRVSGPATVSGATLSITGAGTVVVAGNQAGNSTYAAAPQVTQSILITEPAGLTSPTPGSTLTSSTVTFNWWAGVGVTDYQIRIGTTVAGSNNVFALTTTNLTSGPVTVPAYGVKLYVRLYSLINKVWLYKDYTYTQSGAPVLAAITSPTPGSTLTGSTATFNWTAGGGVTYYQIRVGTKGAGSNDLLKLQGTVLTTGLVSNIPTYGVTLYVRLYSLINGAWQYVDYTYKESGAPVLAALTSPTPGSTLTGSSATFKWSAGNGVTEYQIRIGTTGAGSKDLLSLTTTALTSGVVSNIPISGKTVYVRLYSMINGAWQYTDSTYTEYITPVPAALTSPAPGSTLTGSTASFTWTAGTSVTDYQISVGTTGPGASNLLRLTTTALTSGVVNNIPTTGGKLYVRLYSMIAGAWQYTDSTYTEQ